MAGFAHMSIPEPQPFDQLLSLKGKVAIVTGGTRGIGEAIVLRLAQAGASVVVTARGREALDAVEAKVAAMSGTALALQADASSIADAERVIEGAISRFGRIDVLVNNAAVFPGSLAIEISEKVWDETLDTDLKGAFFLAKLAALKMIEGGRGGRIINVLSTEIIRPTGLLAAYGAAKAGLLAITQSMAKELGQYGIQVNAVIPGSTMTAERLEAFQSGKGAGPAQTVPPEATKTQEKLRELFEKGGLAQRFQNQMPMGRVGFPDDLAKTVLFMASDLASYVSGTSLLVDGAQTLA
jgi:NAD(P)-dependent dehydrogenase (short-subunit alcohol dehydrogenase family)